MINRNIVLHVSFYSDPFNLIIIKKNVPKIRFHYGIHLFLAVAKSSYMNVEQISYSPI